MFQMQQSIPFPCKIQSECFRTIQTERIQFLKAIMAPFLCQTLTCKKILTGTERRAFNRACKIDYHNEISNQNFQEFSIKILYTTINLSNHGNAKIMHCVLPY